jgi:hypothetical protein
MSLWRKTVSGSNKFRETSILQRMWRRRPSSVFQVLCLKLSKRAHKKLEVAMAYPFEVRVTNLRRNSGRRDLDLLPPFPPDTKACRVAAEEPRSHPAGFLYLGSLEGVDVRAENSVTHISRSASSTHVTTYLLTPCTVWLLTGYLVCIYVSIIMVDTLNTFCEYKLSSFCLMVKDLWDILYILCVNVYSEMAVQKTPTETSYPCYINWINAGGLVYIHH